eukprot:COSAG02_NODE_1660_length_11449_cov_6.953128_1_plen_1345_part_00
MFLSMMQEKDAGSRGASGSNISASAPVSPPTGSESGSARSLPAIRGAEPADDVDPLGTSQPLRTSAYESPSSPPRAAAAPAWEDQRAPPAGRSQPGMRYEIYDLSTAELRAELANCRRQPDAPAWRDWASWIADELDERVAGEDIFSAIASLADGCDPDDGAGWCDTETAVGGGAPSMSTQSAPVAAAVSGDSPKRRTTQRQQMGEAEARRHRAAELNRTSGGARRNAQKKKTKKKAAAPAWAGQQADVPLRSEESDDQQTEAPRTIDRTSPQRQSRPKAEAPQRRAPAKATPAVELELELPDVRVQQPPSRNERCTRGHVSDTQAQVARKLTHAVEQQQQQQDLAVVGTEPRHSAVAPHQRASNGITAALVERSASLDKQMENERQQVWLQQQAAEAEAARQALVAEQERDREREKHQREREQAEAAQLAREREEERLRQKAKEEARIEAECREKARIAAAAAEAERCKEQQAAAVEAKAVANAQARAAAEAEAEARRQREAEEVAQLEEESRRRMEEARQIKATMVAARQRNEAAAATPTPQQVETNECFDVRQSATTCTVATAAALRGTDAEADVPCRQETQDAAEVAQLEEDSKRRIDEARQIKAAMVAAKQRKQMMAAGKEHHALSTVSAVPPESQTKLYSQRSMASEPEPEPELEPGPEPEPKSQLRSVFSRQSVDKMPMRRSYESPLPTTDAEAKSSAELEILALRQRAADVKDRREELQVRAAKRQDQARKSAELANPRALGGSESPNRSGGVVANGRRSRNSKSAPDFVLNSAGQMVKPSSAQDSCRGSSIEQEARTVVSQSVDKPAPDRDDDDKPAPLQAPKKSKPARARRSSAAVVPARELTGSEKIIAQHYPTLAQIFGAAHMHTSEPFNLPECVSAAQQAIEKWKVLVEELDGVHENPQQLCYCVQPKDHKKETDVYDIVTESAGRLEDWIEIPWERRGNHSFNLLWSWSNPHKGKTGVDASKLLVWQRVNRFPDSKPLTRKDSLKRNLQRYSALPGDLGAAFNCFPETFNLPKDYKDFLAEFNRVEEEEDGAENIWIMKPVGSSRGRGIFLVSDLNDVTYSEDMVVQRYIHNPLLIDGFKFDLRLYVCVLSFQPLEAYVHHLGFARYSSAEYTCDKQSLENNFIHLTNSSINNAKSTNAKSGSKQSLEELWAVLAAKGIERGPIWHRICEVILRSLFCVVEQMGHHPNCFELFGYDVLIDADLNAHLIEVNSSPALTRQNPLDHEIKGTVITDTIRLVTPPAFNRGKLSELLLKSGGGDERGGQSGNRVTLKHDLACKLDSVLGDDYMESGPRLMDHAGPSEERLGGFEQIAPSKTYDAICRPFGRARPR